MGETPDRVAATLASFREQFVPGEHWCPQDPEIACHAHLGARLLAALDAALAHHVPAVIEDMPEPRFRYCDTCSGHPAWPCPEVAAITAALAKGAGDG